MLNYNTGKMHIPEIFSRLLDVNRSPFDWSDQAADLDHSYSYMHPTVLSDGFSRHVCWQVKSQSINTSEIQFEWEHICHQFTSVMPSSAMFKFKIRVKEYFIYLVSVGIVPFILFLGVKHQVTN